eukprot:GILI01010265.1.p1 GENE.GILI01010265.1~~GILI01010265.1.p1  ORF type:complete len:512 (+),score=157.48 GILI01010265.1:49-1536(+)
MWKVVSPLVLGSAAAAAYFMTRSSCCSRKKVLLLGSGMVAGPCLDYLLKKGNSVTVVSDQLVQAQALVKGKRHTKVVAPIDVTKDQETLRSLVAQHDIVVSLIPATLHLNVANMCIELGKHMVTASYVSADMAKLSERAKNAGIVILNEIGLDPGIDHLAAVKTINEVKEQGGRVHSFESWCGGLPAPQDCNNPLGYKFSWSPKGALNAVRNSAIYRQDGKEVTIPGSELLKHVKSLDIHMAFSFEGYPNRDSLQYMNAYGLSDVDTMFRGTLRYNGFSQIVAAFVDMGLMTDDKPAELSSSSTTSYTWREVIISLTGLATTVSEDTKKALAALNLPDSDGPLTQAILRRIQVDPATQFDKAVTLLRAFLWLGFYSSQQVEKKDTYIDTLCAMLSKKLVYQGGEADLVFLQHRFGITRADGRKETHVSTLCALGEPNGLSAMSRTVGIPCAIATQLVLDGKVSQRGVIIPVEKEVYEPLLEELEHEGIRLHEETL